MSFLKDVEHTIEPIVARLTEHQRSYLISQYKDTQTTRHHSYDTTPKCVRMGNLSLNSPQHRSRRRAGSGTFSMRSRERGCKAPYEFSYLAVAEIYFFW